MRYRSSKGRRRQAEAKPTRDALVASVGRCECCGTSPQQPLWPIEEQNELHCHELLNGPLRTGEGYDSTSCLIVACNRCNQAVLHYWELAKQLALIKVRAPDRYDREEVLRIRNPNAMQYVTEDEVDKFVDEIRWAG